MSEGPPDERAVRALSDILGFADEVEQYVVARGEQHFYADRPTQLVAAAMLDRIGEAVSRLPSEFADLHAEISWRQMKGMRNVVAHQYGFIDYRIVWRALADALPCDIEQIRRVHES